LALFIEYQIRKYEEEPIIFYNKHFDALDIAEERYGVYLEKIEQKE